MMLAIAAVWHPESEHLPVNTHMEVDEVACASEVWSEGCDFSCGSPFEDRRKSVISHQVSANIKLMKR